MKTYKKDGKNFQEWQIGASTFTSIIEKGARLMSWKITVGGITRDIIRWPEDANWNEFRNIRGGNPILFPFMGRNFADGKKFFWKANDGVVRPMPMHGYAVDGDFEIISIDENSVRTRYIPSTEANEGYPYKYDFFVTYFFNELSLKCVFELVNKENSPIPWCAGHHFYFAMPWIKNTTRKDYVLNIPAKKFWHHASNGSLAKAEAPKAPYTFSDPEVCDLLYTKLKTNKISFGPKNGEENIIITLGENEIPNMWATVVTWSESETAPFYCVEPWMGPPNSTDHKNGLCWVNAHSSETFTVSIDLA